MDRRVFLGTSAGFAMFGAQALAFSQKDAENYVNVVAAEINAVIASNKSESATVKAFEQIFRRYADTNMIARYALGREARSFSGSEIKNFTKTFTSYISKKYGSRFREFIGGKIEVKSSRKVRKFYEVKADAVVRGQGRYDLVFLVSDRSGEPLFFNIFVEGINMLLAERTDIEAKLDRHKGDINALIRELRKSV